MFTCGTCWKTFPSGWQARNQHCRDTGHAEPAYECYTCDSYFGSKRAMEQHMDAKDHWGQSSSVEEVWIECDYCDDQFATDAQLAQHEADAHNRCKSCNRRFLNHNNLKMVRFSTSLFLLNQANQSRQHLNSKIHNPSSLTCPFCSKACNTATGLVHHIERGACPKAPLDRIKLYEAVRQRDPDGILSKKLLIWEGASTTYEATDSAWSAADKAWLCYFCSRKFAKRLDLNQHVSSPVHQQNLYHCLNRACSKEFTTLAGVIHHLESESCGYMRFRNVQKYVGNVVAPGKRITEK